eukprot:COSAG02_NODE_2019_length_10091_cov_13.354283_1_plen_237_part_00
MASDPGTIRPCRAVHGANAWHQQGGMAKRPHETGEVGTVRDHAWRFSISSGNVGSGNTCLAVFPDRLLCRPKHVATRGCSMLHLITNVLLGRVASIHGAPTHQVTWAPTTREGSAKSDVAMLRPSPTGERASSPPSPKCLGSRRHELTRFDYFWRLSMRLLLPACQPGHCFVVPYVHTAPPLTTQSSQHAQLTELSLCFPCVAVHEQAHTHVLRRCCRRRCWSASDEQLSGACPCA